MTFPWHTTGNTISWTVTKTLNNTEYLDTSYTLNLNNQYFNSSTWVNDTPVVINFDALTWGTYTYTITFSDGLGGFCIDSGSIIVDEGPSLNHLGNLTYVFGTTGQSIAWNVSYGMTGPLQSYNVLINGTLSPYSGAWTAGGSIPSPTIMLDNLHLGVGVTTFTCNVTDGYGGYDTSTVTVTVLDDVPQINTPATVVYPFNTTGNSITWVVMHFASSSGSYTVYVNGTTTWVRGTWNSSQPIIVSVDNCSLGTYHFQCVATDAFGRQNASLVQVTVTDDIPRIRESPITYTYGEAGNHYLTWSVWDFYTGPSTSYTIWQNNSEIAHWILVSLHDL